MAAANLNKWYPFYLWFLSNLIASVFLFLLSLSISTARGVEPDALFGFYVMLSAGLLYSIPAGVLCLVVYRLVVLKPYAPAVIKAIIGVAAIAGMLLTLLRLFGAEALDWRNDPSGLELSLVYSVSIILSGTFLKIYKRPMPVA